MKRYRKLKIVGEGSYSKCWLAQTEGSDSIYVVKVIPKKKLELLVK
jgi:serine/threonine protein kinase